MGAAPLAVGADWAAGLTTFAATEAASAVRALEARPSYEGWHPGSTGGRRDRTLYADPPPPPPSLPGFGPEVPDHGRRRRPKEILLDLVEGEKLGFCPMCLYSKYSVFLGEPNSG